MTKPIKFGEMSNKMDAKQFKKEMANLKPGDGVDGYEYGADLHVQSAPMVDAQEGEPILIRSFEFKMNPDPKIRKKFPTNLQTLFNDHAKQISAILWGDGLVPFESVPPRVIIDKKGLKYQIFVTCVARKGVLFSNRPQSLSEVLTKTS